MGTLSLSAAIEKVRLAKPFRISGYVFDDSDLLVVTLREGSHEGRGEASGVYYLGDQWRSQSRPNAVGLSRAAHYTQGEHVIGRRTRRIRAAAARQEE